MLEALRALHNIGYVHGDIKLDNVCGKFDPQTFQYYYSLIDFGLV
jgi:serine/threonine protein kinase